MYLLIYIVVVNEMILKNTKLTIKGNISNNNLLYYPKN